MMEEAQPIGIMTPFERGQSAKENWQHRLRADPEVLESDESDVAH